MELVKLNEAYTLTDELENGWKASGQVIREQSGELRINFSINKQDTYIGNYNYDIYAGNDNVNVNYSAVKGQEDAVCEYGDSLVEQIMERLNNQLNN